MLGFMSLNHLGDDAAGQIAYMKYQGGIPLTTTETIDMAAFLKKQKDAQAATTAGQASSWLDSINGMIGKVQQTIATINPPKTPKTPKPVQQPMAPQKDNTMLIVGGLALGALVLFATTRKKA